jgi:hypothetical protein
MFLNDAGKQLFNALGIVTFAIYPAAFPPRSINLLTAVSIASWFKSRIKTVALALAKLSAMAKPIPRAAR